jgi:hypothetical protein
LGNVKGMYKISAVAVAGVFGLMVGPTWIGWWSVPLKTLGIAVVIMAIVIMFDAFYFYGRHYARGGPPR